MRKLWQKIKEIFAKLTEPTNYGGCFGDDEHGD